MPGTTSKTSGEAKSTWMVRAIEILIGKYAVHSGLAIAVADRVYEMDPAKDPEDAVRAFMEKDAPSEAVRLVQDPASLLELVTLYLHRVPRPLGNAITISTRLIPVTIKFSDVEVKTSVCTLNKMMDLAGTQLVTDPNLDEDSKDVLDLITKIRQAKPYL